MTRLDDIRARLAAITPGPWGGVAIKLTEIPGDYTAYVTRKYLGADEVIAECFGDEATPAKEDAEFIAAAPEDMRFLLAENERLQTWVNDLQSGMYVNCVYCGHRYGPNETTPVTMADALKAHIEQCPKHPMSALKAENERLQAENKRLRRRYTIA